MGLLSRFADIISANINDLLDKAEDPAKMVDQCLRDMMEDLAEVKKETAAVMAEESEVMNSALSEIGFPVGNVSDSFFYFNSLEPLGMECAEFKKKMLNRGIMVRDCSSFGDEFKGYVRYSVKDRERNCRFIAAVDSVING